MRATTDVGNGRPPLYDRDPARRRLIGLLMLGALAGALAVMPYSLSVTFAGESEVPLWPAMLIGQLLNLVLILACVLIGLRLGPPLGLHTPLLSAWAEGRAVAPGRVRRTLLRGLLIGAAAGVAVTVISGLAELVLEVPEFRMPTWPAWQGLLGAFGAGVNEELMFRLGLMTLFVWLLTKLLRRTPPQAVVIWAGGALAALAFGFAHLPLLAVLLEPTAATIGLMLLGNGIIGVTFGWVFWRRGLLAAMAAHFAADVVLKVLVPALLL